MRAGQVLAARAEYSHRDVMMLLLTIALVLRIYDSPSFIGKQPPRKETQYLEEPAA